MPGHRTVVLAHTGRRRQAVVVRAPHRVVLAKLALAVAAILEKVADGIAPASGGPATALAVTGPAGHVHEGGDGLRRSRLIPSRVDPLTLAERLGQHLCKERRMRKVSARRYSHSRFIVAFDCMAEDVSLGSSGSAITLTVLWSNADTADVMDARARARSIDRIVCSGRGPCAFLIGFLRTPE